MREVVLLGILALCCLVIPLLSLGGLGIALGFLRNNLAIISSGLLLIVLGITLYFRGKR